MAESITYQAPDRIVCQESCTVPEGVRLTATPRPRHDWGGMLHCPNDGCGISFLVERLESEGAADA